VVQENQKKSISTRMIGLVVSLVCFQIDKEFIG
jgi:hypothetical protein